MNFMINTQLPARSSTQKISTDWFGLRTKRIQKTVLSHRLYPRDVGKDNITFITKREEAFERGPLPAFWSSVPQDQQNRLYAILVPRIAVSCDGLGEE